MHLMHGTKHEAYSRYVGRKAAMLMLAGGLLALVSLISISKGAANLPLQEVAKALLGYDVAKRYELIVWNIRLPQVLAAIVAGAGLSLSGAVMQSVLRNPLGSPFTLGISHAAAFGAAFAVMILGSGTMASSQVGAITLSNPYLTTGMAFLFSMAASGLIVGISRMRGATPEIMVLCGVALGALFTAGTMFLQFFADDVQLAAMVFWTFGDVGRASWSELGVLSFITLTASAYFLINSWNYNAVDAGDETARGLGVRVQRGAHLGHAGIFSGHGRGRGLFRHHRLCGSGLPPYGQADDRRRQSFSAARFHAAWSHPAAGVRYRGPSFIGAPSAARFHPYGIYGSTGLPGPDHQRICKMILDVNGVKFGYNGKAVLKDVQLGVKEGEMLVILGPNGVGKTTLLRCINAILKPKAGTIMVDGKNVLKMEPRAIARRVGYVAQQQARTRMTAFDAILMGRKPHLRFRTSERIFTWWTGPSKCSVWKNWPCGISMR